MSSKTEDRFTAILKAVKEQGMLSERAVEKEYRETVNELIEEGLMKHVKEQTYELTEEGSNYLRIYRKFNPRKYEKLKAMI